MRAISVAALLALQCVAGVRLGSGGGPLARLRDDLDRHPLAAVQWGKRRTLPKRPNPNDQRRLAAPPPTNTTALHIIDAIGRHWLIYERLTNLVLRSAGRVFSKIKSCIGIFADYPPRVMVVTMSGVIAHDSEASLSTNMLLDSSLVSDRSLAAARRNGELINLERFDAVLTRAFRATRCRAVALVINSPGGSPAQSSLIYKRLRELRRRHPKTKLIAYVQDSAASGGYYIACAADEIVCDTNSLVGSIGVVSRGFGYVRALKKQGVERRIHAAGESKAGMDPYLKVTNKDLARQRRLLRELHGNFIGAVKDGRGDRLKPEAAARLHHRTSVAAGTLRRRLPSALTEPSRSTLRKLQAQGAGLFDGAVYSGTAGIEVGLVDGIGEISSDMSKRFGRHVQLVNMEPEEPVDYGRLLRWLF